MQQPVEMTNTRHDFWQTHHIENEGHNKHKTLAANSGHNKHWTQKTKDVYL